MASKEELQALFAENNKNLLDGLKALVTKPDPNQEPITRANLEEHVMAIFDKVFGKPKDDKEKKSMFKLFG